MIRPLLKNRAARALWLDRHALAEAPSGPAHGPALTHLIRRLGFVQVDSIDTVARAHHMILRARRTAYRPKDLHGALARRELFEHWTHDASVIPTAFYPHWRLRFARDARALSRRWQRFRGNAFLRSCDEVIAQIAETGACGTSDLGKEETRKPGGWWEWTPSKTALEYLWRSGRLTVCHRKGFRKFYDLTERVLPDQAKAPAPPPQESLDWLNGAALDRLGFATSGELARFWDTATPAESADWMRRELAAGRLIELDVESADGSRRTHVARPDILDDPPPRPPGRARILSPFDPALRDRARTERLFGFHYRIEVFTPAPKRRYGYYVFPVLEGDRLTGRIDATAPKMSDALQVTAFWPERGVKLGPARLARVEAELQRLATFCGKLRVDLSDGWQREAL